jgi:ribosome recycling factor
VRTGRANISMLDGVRVEYYGTMTPLNQVATLNVPDPRLITIKPWEKSLIPMIEKAIKAQSDLGLNPNSDGEQVRLPIPPLTQERRKDLVKMIKKLAEEAKVALRGSRREANENLKEFTDSGDISEDDQRQGQKKVQDLTDKYTATVDDIAGKKEKEILEG